MRFWVHVFFAFFAAGCTLSSESPEDAKTPALTSFELFFSRSSFTKTEYEHYKANSSELFYECGELRRGRFFQDENSLATIPQDILGELNQKLASILTYYSTHHPRLAEEGDNSNFADPGKFVLTLQGDQLIEFKGSFDGVSNKDGPFEERLFDLVRYVRSIPPDPPCFNKRFFGIPTLKAIEEEKAKAFTPEQESPEKAGSSGQAS